MIKVECLLCRQAHDDSDWQSPTRIKAVFTFLTLAAANQATRYPRRFPLPQR